jgi:hypothetical protein
MTSTAYKRNVELTTNQIHDLKDEIRIEHGENGHNQHGVFTPWGKIIIFSRQYDFGINVKDNIPIGNEVRFTEYKGWTYFLPENDVRDEIRDQHDFHFYEVFMHITHNGVRHTIPGGMISYQYKWFNNRDLAEQFINDELKRKARHYFLKNRVYGAHQPTITHQEKEIFLPEKVDPFNKTPIY